MAPGQRHTSGQRRQKIVYDTMSENELLHTQTCRTQGVTNSVSSGDFLWVGGSKEKWRLDAKSSIRRGEQGHVFRKDENLKINIRKLYN